MTNLLADWGVVILSIAGFVGIVILTAYLCLNEKKLKEMKSTQELKKMYRDALYLSMFVVIIGILIYVSGMYTEGDIGGDIGFFGGSALWAGLIAVVYSSLGLYSIIHGKQQN